MEQAVAVSDPRNRPEHPWNYSWADPADEAKMKAQLEDLARSALGLNAAAGSGNEADNNPRTRAKPIRASAGSCAAGRRAVSRL